MSAIEVMEGAGHGADAFVGIYHHKLRRREVLLRAQKPREIKGIDTHDKARKAAGRDLGLRKEVAAVYKVEAVGLTALLRCVMGHKGREGIVLVGGNAALAVYGLLSAMEGNPRNRALSRPGTVQRNHVKCTVVPLHAAGQKPLDAKLIVSVVDDAGTSRNHRKSRKHRIRKLRGEIKMRIL